MERAYSGEGSLFLEWHQLNPTPTPSELITQEPEASRTDRGGTKNENEMNTDNVSANVHVLYVET